MSTQTRIAATIGVLFALGLFLGYFTHSAFDTRTRVVNVPTVAPIVDATGLARALGPSQPVDTSKLGQLAGFKCEGWQIRTGLVLSCAQ